LLNPLIRVDISIEVVMSFEARTDWPKAVLAAGATMADAVRVLNDASLRFVLVLDEQGKILGTVTDGDVRRGLIRQLGMNVPISEIMNPAPVAVNLKMKRDDMVKVMQDNDILQLPVIDDSGFVVGVEFLQQLSTSPVVENVAVLMAGGFGKRLQPLTSSIPKPMLKVGSKPILETIVEQLVESGFKKIFISVFYKASMVQQYFGDGNKWGVEINYLIEDRPLGTAGALSLLPDDIGSLPVLVMNGDILTKVDFLHLLAFHKEQDCDLTVCVREYDFQIPYGVVEVADSRIIGLTEKPVQSVFVNAGIYVVKQNLFRARNNEATRDMTDLIERQIEEQRPVNVFPIHEYWIDIGRMEEYKRANLDVEKSIVDG